MIEFFPGLSLAKIAKLVPAYWVLISTVISLFLK
jgi:hypothetical protein